MASVTERLARRTHTRVAGRTTITWIYVLVLLGLWGYHAAYSYGHFGLFQGLGVDFGLYYAQSRALGALGPRALYDRDALAAFHQSLVTYTADPGQQLEHAAVLYPPLFAALFTPIALLPPPVGYALWTLINFGALLYLAQLAARFFPRDQRLLAAALVMSAYPLLQTLAVGQPTILLSCALAHAYLALRAERDGRAGMWLGALLFKPQYIILIAPLLLWKRRWRALGGLALTALGILLGSLWASDWQTLFVAYPAALVEATRFGGGNFVHPLAMVNMRALVLTLAPSLSSNAGLLLTALLGALVVLLAAWAWRGTWRPRAPRFAARMLLLLIATMLATYHSHSYSLALLVVPAAALWSAPQQSAWPRRMIVVTLIVLNLLIAIFFLTTLSLRLPLFLLRAAPLVPLALSACFAALWLYDWRYGAQSDEPPPSQTKEVTLQR